VLAASLLAAPVYTAAAQDNTVTDAAAVAKKAEEARKKAEAEYRANLKSIDTLVSDLHTQKKKYIDRIAEVKTLLSDPAYADTRLQLRINEQIIRFCQQPPWTHIANYDYDAAHKELPPAANAILDSTEFAGSQKLFAARALAIDYCDYNKFQEAEAVARRAIAFPALSDHDKAKAYGILADVFRLQDKYAEAMATAREAMKYHAVSAATIGADVALSFGKIADADAIWKEADAPYDKLNYIGSKRRSNEKPLKSLYLSEAIAFVNDTNNEEAARFNVAQHYLFETFGSKEMSAARQSLAGIPARKNHSGWPATNKIKRPFQLGDFPLTVELCEVYAGSQVMDDAAIRKIYVIALGALGENAEGAKLAAEYAKDEKMKPVDQIRFRFYEAILSGKSTDNLMKGTTLSRRERADVLLSAARQTLTWNMSDLSEKYSVAYETFFAERPERRIVVKYFDTPVSNITAWRSVYPQLEKQYCDIPYKGSMDFLETDVSTGDRNVKIDEKGDVVESIEISTLCDRYGNHIFLRAAADNARDIERGFARGISTEIYFAPGVNQPYTCLGSAPAEGVTFMFHTAYNNMNHKRLDKDAPQTSFRSEVEFTDTDYVLHLFFAWDGYYNKLPANGTDWRFECLAWLPTGAFSFGGSQGIHSASAWGNLRLELTNKQLNEIRKEIIVKSYRSYKNVPRDPGTKENLFQCWADSEIGDPDFYQTVLEPIEKELDAYAAMVKVDMSDEDVAKIHSNALPRWKGLAHEVDELRRKYLTDRIVRTGGYTSRGAD